MFQFATSLLSTHLYELVDYAIDPYPHCFNYHKSGVMTLPTQAVAVPVSSTAKPADPVLEIQDLHTYFFLEKGIVKAVNGVNLTLQRQSTLGVVGESGCGKSVTAMSTMRLVKWPPGKIVDGQILLHRKDGRPPVDLVRLDPRGPEIRAIRGGEIGMIFQEPMTSLNPLKSIGNQIAEAVKLHQNVNDRAALERAEEMLHKVNISAPKQRLPRISTSIEWWHAPAGDDRDGALLQSVDFARRRAHDSA